MPANEGEATAEIRLDLSRLPEDIRRGEAVVLAGLQSVEKKAAVTVKLAINKQDLAAVKAEKAKLLRNDQLTFRINTAAFKIEAAKVAAAKKQLATDAKIAFRLHLQNEREIAAKKAALARDATIAFKAVLRNEQETAAKLAAMTRDRTVTIHTRTRTIGGVGISGGSNYSFDVGSLGGARSFTAAAGAITIAATAAAALAAAIVTISAATAKAGADLVKFGIASGAAVETQIQGFDTLLRQREGAGRQLLQTIRAFSDVSPFQVTDIATTTQQLLTVNRTGNTFNQNAALEQAKTLANAVSALGQNSPAKLERVTAAAVKMGSSFKVSARELNSITLALPGFNAKTELAQGAVDRFASRFEELGIVQQNGKLTSEQTAEAIKAISAGAITGAEGLDILMARIQAFPGVAGATEKQAATLAGRFSTFKDVVQGDFGLRFLDNGTIGGLADAFPDLTESARKFVEGFADATGPKLVSAFKALPDFIDTVGPAFTGLFTKIVSGVEEFVTEAGPAVANILDAVGSAVESITPIIIGATRAISDFIDGTKRFSGVQIPGLPGPLGAGLLGVADGQITQAAASGVQVTGATRIKNPIYSSRADIAELTRGWTEYAQARLAAAQAEETIAAETSIEALTGSIDGLNTATQNTVETAKQLVATFDKLTGGKLNLASATAEVNAARLELLDVLEKNAKGRFNTTTLEGLENFDAVKTQGISIRDRIGVQLEAGVDVDKIKADFNAANLVLTADVAAAFDIDSEEAQKQLTELGVLVDLPIGVVIDNARRSVLQEQINKLTDEESENAKIEIQALLDAGSYDQAEAALLQLSSDIEPVVRPIVQTAGATEALNDFRNRESSTPITIRVNTVPGRNGTIRTNRAGGEYIGGTSTTGSFEADPSAPEYLLFNERSTRGEMFISFDPAYRQDNERLVKRAAAKLGMSGDFDGVATSSGGSSGGQLGSTALLAELRQLRAEIRALKDARGDTINVVAPETKDPSQFASSVFWELRKRRGVFQ